MGKNIFLNQEFILSPDTYHVFYPKKVNKKLINSTKSNKYKILLFPQLSNKTIEGVEKMINTHVNPPSKPKSIYLLRIKYNPDSINSTLILTCSQFTLNSKLKLSMIGDSSSIKYTREDFKKYGFKLSQVRKIISLMEQDLIDVSVQFIKPHDIF